MQFKDNFCFCNDYWNILNADPIAKKQTNKKQIVKDLNFQTH